MISISFLYDMKCFLSTVKLFSDAVTAEYVMPSAVLTLLMTRVISVSVVF